jgi:E3 ubiquitin-protein ligase RNF5
MEIERSLHQIWFFLFVFVVLCLLLFWDKTVLYTSL